MKKTIKLYKADDNKLSITNPKELNDEDILKAIQEMSKNYQNLTREYLFDEATRDNINLRTSRYDDDNEFNIEFELTDDNMYFKMPKYTFSKAELQLLNEEFDNFCGYYGLERGTDFDRLVKLYNKICEINNNLDYTIEYKSYIDEYNNESFCFYLETINYNTENDGDWHKVIKAIEELNSYKTNYKTITYDKPLELLKETLDNDKDAQNDDIDDNSNNSNDNA